MKIQTFQSFYQFSCNVYVISSDKGNILIDPGYYDEKIRDYIEQIGGLDAVLLTHGHWDHTYGLDRLKGDFPEALVYISKDGKDFLKDPLLNCSIYIGAAEVIHSEVNIIQGNSLRIGGYDIDVIDTPGHCRGCVMYYFKKDNVLFTGDSIMKDISVPIRPTGSEKEQMESMRKFIHLGYPKDTPVYPGHGASTTYGYLLENNSDIKVVSR